VSFATSCICLELRPLPSTRVTRFPRYYEPLRHPRAPGLSLTGVRLVLSSLTWPRLGLPVLRALSLCTCCRHYPGAAAGRRPRSSHPAVPAFPDNVVGSACTSSFSRPAQRSLALRPAHSRGHLYVTSYTEGFSHFVTSMTAPVASGWSGCRVGLAPTGKRRLGTAHTSSGRSGACCARRQRLGSAYQGQLEGTKVQSKAVIPWGEEWVSLPEGDIARRTKLGFPLFVARRLVRGVIAISDADRSDARDLIQSRGQPTNRPCASDIDSECYNPLCWQVA